jgi:hypothetical protein
MTIEQTVEVPSSHRLMIDVPSEIPAGWAKIKLTVKAKSEERRIPFVSWLLNRRAERQTRAIMQFAGCLKDSPAFEGDSVEIVRKIRDEWDRHWDKDAGEA